MKRYLYLIVPFIAVLFCSLLLFTSVDNKINELIGTVISGFLRVCVENRLLPRTTTVYPARTTDPTRFFGNADNR